MTGTKSKYLTKCEEQCLRLYVAVAVLQSGDPLPENFFDREWHEVFTKLHNTKARDLDCIAAELGIDPDRLLLEYLES